jgi:hypothetical protein
VEGNALVFTVDEGGVLCAQSDGIHGELRADPVRASPTPSPWTSGQALRAAGRGRKARLRDLLTDETDDVSESIPSLAARAQWRQRLNDR